MANLENFRSYDELSKYYRSICKEIEYIEILLKKREKEIETYYRNERKEILKVWIERESELKKAKKYRSMSALHGTLEANSLSLIEYKNAILAEWKNSEDYEELYFFLEYLKHEKSELETILNQGKSRFNRNIDKLILKDYIFEKISNYDELIAYMHSLKKEKSILEQKIEQEKNQETYLKLQASLASIESEITELAKIFDIIIDCRKKLEPEFLDQSLYKLSNEIYKQYRNTMIKKYLAKKSAEAYTRFYNQEIFDNLSACKTLERIAADTNK